MKNEREERFAECNIGHLCHFRERNKGALQTSELEEIVQR